MTKMPFTFRFVCDYSDCHRRLLLSSPLLSVSSCLTGDEPLTSDLSFLVAAPLTLSSVAPLISDLAATSGFPLTDDLQRSATSAARRTSATTTATSLVTSPSSTQIGDRPHTDTSPPPPTSLTPSPSSSPMPSQTQNKIEAIPQIETSFLPNDLRFATVELIPYFTDGFGNSTGIDYGIGHETNFAAWLYCLARIGVIREEDYHAVVSRVFVKERERERGSVCAFWFNQWLFLF